MTVKVHQGDNYIRDRILTRYWEAADTVLLDGSTPWEIDEAMVEFGYVRGPYEDQDILGLDLVSSARAVQNESRDPKLRYIPIADRMIELGKLGRKTGAGWYRYPGGGGKVEDPIVADLALEEAHFAGICRTDYRPHEIRERLLMAMIQEATNVLCEGIAEDSSDIDLISVRECGFPNWRGGLVKFADTLGVGEILETLRRLVREDPIAWKPSIVLVECETEKVAIKDWRPRQQLHRI